MATEREKKAHIDKLKNRKTVQKKRNSNMASIISPTSENNRDLTSKNSFSYESSSTTSQGDKNSFGNLSLKENDDSL